MPLMTVPEYEESLRKRDIQVYLFGERLPNVVDHPILRPAFRCIAEVYRLALEPDTRDLMTATSHLTGETVNASSILWRSREDLEKRVEWERLVSQLTGRGALRSPGLDALNALATTTWEMDRTLKTDYGRRFESFLREVHENDWAVSGAMTDPRGDRSRRPSEQADPDLFLRVVERRDDGIVVRGAKMHQTSAIHSHWHLVLPLQCREADRDYAVAFAVPSDDPGISHVYSRQPSDTRKTEEGGDLDQGLAAFGGCETLMIFDNVFVPWERVYLCGEWDYTTRLVERFGSFHRFCYGGCKVGIGDIVIGAAALAAEANGVADKPLIRDKLTEMLHLNETMYACSVAAAAKAKPHPSGVWIPDLGLANVAKLNVTRFPFVMARLAADIAGGIMLTLPSERDLRSEKVGPWIKKYLRGVDHIPTETRIRILRLLENLTYGTNATYFLHESLHGAGSPESQKITIRKEFDLESRKRLARRLAQIPESA